MTELSGAAFSISDKDLVGRSWPIYCGQEAEEFRSEVMSRLRTLSKGSAIAYESQSISCVVCVLDGWLALSKSLGDGQTQIIDFALPGDIWLPTSADGLTSLYDIVAQTPVRLAIFSMADWEKMERDIPGLLKLVRSLEAGAHARLSERYLRMGKGSAPMKIAYALLEFFGRLKHKKTTSAQRFHIPLRQQQLGDFTGVSSVHVCRTLKQFSRHRLLTIANHMDVTIHDLLALAEIAEVNITQLMISTAPQWQH